MTSQDHFHYTNEDKCCILVALKLHIYRLTPLPVAVTSPYRYRLALARSYRYR